MRGQVYQIFKKEIKFENPVQEILKSSLLKVSQDHGKSLIYSTLNSIEIENHSDGLDQLSSIVKEDTVSNKQSSCT